MLTRFAKFILVLALAVSIGLHWALLQTVAWTGMLINYSHDVSFTDAVSKTFDGAHPCPLCKLIQAGKKAEQKETKINVQTKLEFGMPLEVFRLNARRPFLVQPGVLNPAQSRLEPPPTPPPRLA